MGITQCAEICPFKTASGWCGLTGCIRRHTTTEISANPVLVIPDDYVKVVRCRDCKFWQNPQVMLPDGTFRDYLPGEIDPLLGRLGVTADIGVNIGGYCNGYWTENYVAEGRHEWKNEDDYCSRGERRDDDADNRR